MRRSHRIPSISQKIDIAIQCRNPLSGGYPNPANGNYRFKGQSHQRKRPPCSAAMGEYYDLASPVPRVQRCRDCDGGIGVNADAALYFLTGFEPDT